MIYYPLYSLKSAGVDIVMIVSGRGHAGHFLELLGSGSHFGMKFSYEVQEEAGGIAQALGLTETFSDNEKIIVVLGDNIFEDSLEVAVKDFAVQPRGARIFLKEVSRPEAYGVADVVDGEIRSIEEKPSSPKSKLAVTGLYMYDSQVYDIIRKLSPSKRNELEITDVNNFYLNQGTLRHHVLSGFWGDCGESFDSLIDASFLVQNSYLANVSDDLLLK
jgi:glucose-1-phosphate thymidylyltransferase